MEHDSIERLYLENVPNQKMRFKKKNAASRFVASLYERQSSLYM